MIDKLNKLVSMMAGLWLLANILACESSPKNAPGQKQPAEQKYQSFQIDAATFEPADSLQHLRSALNESDIERPESDFLWALAYCQCAPNKAGQYLAQRSEAQGALPQPLVPTVRKEILADSKLQFLLRLKNNFSNIGNALEKMFANDDKIAESVRTGLNQKISTALASRSNLAQQVKFRFDLFTPATGRAILDQPAKSMTIAEQSILWAFPFARPEIWQNKNPLAFGDHSLQLLYVAKTLAAWQYVYGLKSESDDASADVGGLVFNPLDGENGKITAFDPRQSSDAPAHIVSGTYRVSFPDSGAVELATNIVPKWQRDADSVTLIEQATLAIGAATAFGRLRPENRDTVRNAFGAGRLLPDNTHELPLIFIAALGELLDGPFINSDKQEIYRVANLNNGQRSELATLRGLTRLLHALTLWTIETKDLSLANIGASTRKQLEDSHGELLRAAQLTIQTILARYVRLGSFTTEKDSFSLVIDEEGTPPPFAEAAELIAVLANDVAGLFASPLLNERLGDLLNWFAATYLEGDSKEKLSPAGILWTSLALKNASKIPEKRRNRTPWAAAASIKLGQLLEEWQK